MSNVITEHPTEFTRNAATTPLGRDASARIAAAKREALEELAQALETKELAKLRDDLETAQDALAELRAEYKRGNQNIAETAQAGDAAKLAKLSARLQALPSLILSAEFRAVNAQLALIDAERAILDAVAQNYTKDRIEPLQAQQAALALDIRALESQRYAVISRQETNRDKRRALRERRDAIIGELQQGATPFALRKR